PLHAAAIRAAYRDVAIIAAPVLIALAALLTFGLGSAASAGTVLVTSLLNLSATLGTAAILGWQVSQFSFIVMPVVLTVGLLDGIHLAMAVRQARTTDGVRGSHDGDAAVRTAIVEVFAPCAWTTATTAAGFCVLTASSIPQIRQFGALSAVGTVWALFTSFVLLPGLLARLRPPTTSLSTSRLAAISRRIAHMKRPGLVVAATLIVLAATAPGLARVRVAADFPRLFDRDHEITVELERIERDWGGIASVSFLLTPLPGHELGDSEVIERLSSFGRLLAQRELVTSVVSPLDVVGTAPTDPAAIERLIAQASAGPSARLLSELLDSPTDTLRVVARVRMMQPEKFPALAADLEGFRAGLEDLFEVKLAGWPLVFKNLETRLLDELLSSFALAFGVVAILMGFALGATRWWLAALIPNLAPLWIVLGGLGLAGSGFSSGLLLAPGIALGLVVDDTIHFVSALRRQSRDSRSLRDAIESAIDRTGAALTLTSAVLVAGFGTLLLSAFRGNQTLGAVMVAVVLVAWLADLVVLPAVLLLTERRGGTPDAAVREPSRFRGARG
ncbi:MAG: MMPL family transporter, partial [Candidatus Binatia bacterium]